MMESPLLSRVGIAPPVAVSPELKHPEDVDEDEEELDSASEDEEDERVLAAAFSRQQSSVHSSSSSPLSSLPASQPPSSSSSSLDAIRDDEIESDAGDDDEDADNLLDVGSSRFRGRSSRTPTLTRDEIESSLRVLIETYPNEVSIAWAAPRLLRTGQIKLLLRLAHARREMPLCLEALATHGTVCFSHHALIFYLNILHLDSQCIVHHDELEVFQF
jgi:hypothetical protein